MEVGDDLRVDNHDLALLTMGPSSTVEEHRIRTCHHHCECADIDLAILVWYMAAVNCCRVGCLQGFASTIFGTLSYSMVAGTKLKLNDVANCGSNRVGNECVLGTTDNDRNKSVLSAYERRASSYLFYVS
jgi:hypothetical protein